MWSDALSPVRWLVRGTLFLWHATVNLAVALALMGPWGRRTVLWGRPLSEWALTFWSNGTCRLFGIVPRWSGQLADGPVLVVSNHLSWADIQLMHCVGPVSFVAKAEIGDWPVFGFLANRGGTIYHKRGCHDSASSVFGQVLAHLEGGGRVAVFPEGGVLPGSHVHRFHARMFKVAQETQCAIQPAMVRYLSDRRRDDDAGFRDGEPFVPNLVRMMGRRSVVADLQFLEPFEPEGLPRKQLAARAEAAVREAYDAPVALDGEPSVA